MAEKQNEQKENDYLAVVKKMVEEIKFGTVSIIVQDGKIVQLEQNKKVRM